MQRATGFLTVLSLALAFGAGCKNKKGTNEPEPGSNLLGVDGSDGSLDMGGGAGFSLDEDAQWEPEARPKLPKRAQASEKCTRKGKGKFRKQECRMVDPKPQVSASHGVYALMEDFRWGMTPSQVYWVLARDIEDEYSKRQQAASEAVEQDENRRWRQEQLAALKGDHTQFTSASKHRWGVSLIAYEYEDDSDEEMLFVRTENGLRKFYFFKDDELWKIFHAYGNQVWPGKGYKEVVDEKFKEWFGPSPQEKVKTNEETGAPLVRYLEWTAMDGEKVRAFDLTELHGVVGLAVIDGTMESRIGERLPDGQRDEELTGSVDDVVGGADVCYNDNGDIETCSEDKAMGLE